MSETLLSASEVRLYGRVVQGLGVDLSSAPRELGANQLLRRQLEAEGARFARIYSVAFGGVEVDLPTAMLMLVHGDGEEVPQRQSGPQIAGLRVWIYDKSDYSLRLDVASGTLEQLLGLGVPGPAAGMNVGMNIGMNAGMNVGMNAGMNVGMNIGMNAGMNVGVRPRRDE